MGKSFLIIQTAFLGDVILATALIEKLSSAIPHAEIDMLVRKGNESVLDNNPHLENVLVWNKQENKFKNLWSLLKKIRKKKYDVVINLQRFASTGLLTAFSNAKEKTGFNKNPFSFLFTTAIPHTIGDGKHETERNQKLIAHLTDENTSLPRLYPSNNDDRETAHLKKATYITIAPGSVWFTKTFPKTKWIEFIGMYHQENPNALFYLLGSKSEYLLAEDIRLHFPEINILNLAGKLTYLQSASLMKDAFANYVNDSAPLHIASAMNASVTSIFCSTISEFGFGPLSTRSRIVQTNEKLECRPCGLHGFNACPLGHFKCAYTIEVKDMMN